MRFSYSPTPNPGVFTSFVLLFAFCFLLSGTKLSAQKPETSKPTLSFCGSLHHADHNEDKPSPPLAEDDERIYSDRFGNYYTDKDLLLPQRNIDRVSGSGDPAKLQTGYFNPVYTDVPEDVQTLINDILLEVSTVFVQTQGIDECSQGYQLNLDILWGDFGMPEAEIWEENNIDNLPGPETGILGIGSPFYDRTISSFCLGIAADRPYSKINGGWIHFPDRLDGRILLNSNVAGYSGGDFSYLLNSIDNPTEPTGLQFDLHTIFLHELLHVLGIASRIDPSLEASSRYDLELRVQNDAGENSPLLIQDPEEPGCYMGHPEINDFLFNDCNDDRSIGFLASDEIAMQSGTFTVERVGNGFSHFVNICGEAVNYVMSPGILPGQSVRIISPEELAIFCAMGYQTPSIDCEGCYVLGWSRGNARVAEQDPCSFLPDICAGVRTTFSLSELTRLHTNSESVEWGDPIAIIQSGDDLEDSVIEFEINGDEVTILVSPDSHGDLKVYFPVTACDDGQITVLTHAFVVSAVCDDCSTVQETTCGNISCSTDFEEYPYTNSFITFGEVMRLPGRASTGIPRLVHSTDPLNNHLFIREQVPATIELLSPVLPGCEVTISFDAVLAGLSGGLNLWGSEVRMCSASEVSIGVPADCNDTGTDCGDDFFIPYCLGQTDDIINTAPPFLEREGLESAPDFESYTSTFINNSEFPLNFIYIFAPIETRNPINGCYLDNIEATTRCPINIETTPTAPDLFCKGSSETLSVVICNNALEPASLSISLNSLPGWNFTISDNTLELEESSCSTITFDALPDAEIDDGDYTIELTIDAENECGSVASIIEQFEVSVTECDESPFTCACEGPNAINLVAGEGTPLSQFIALGEMPSDGINNRCLAISGNLIVDESSVGTGGFYGINRSEVRMQPGSSITVEAGATLSVSFSIDGGVHGCENLWQGISLSPRNSSNDGGRLRLRGARITDAVHAVDLNDESTLEMIYSTLDRNYIGIYMAPSLTPGTETVIQPTPLQYSSIRVSDDLLPAFDGQEISTGSESHAGIELNDCKNFQIGGGNIGIAISGANHGVIARGSNVSIVSSTIHSTTTPLDGSEGSTGILAESSSWIDLRNSRLYGMENGVLGYQSSLDARNNTIGEDPSGSHGNITHGISLEMSIGQVASITNQNKIYGRRSGVTIKAAHQANSLMIENNTVELTGPGIPNDYAVGVLDALMSGINEGQKVIENNIINIRDRGYGIGTYNVNGVTIVDNNINFFPGTYSGTAGIALIESSQNYVSNNRVSMTDGPIDNFLTGINVYNGDQNALCCNSLEDTYYGVVFAGYCEETKLRHTAFSGNSIGLFCNPNTRIGEQDAAGNTWDESLIWQARHQSPVQNDVIQSSFFVPPGGSTFPQNVSVTAGVPWFYSGVNGPSCSEDLDNCQRPVLNRLASNGEFTQKILQNDFYYGDYPATSNWEAKRIFYRSQKATAAVNRSNWSRASKIFFGKQTRKNTALHQLTNVAQTLEEALLTDPLMTELSSNIAQLNDRLFTLDQTIEEGEDPTEEYLTARAALLEQQAEAFTRFSGRLQQKENTHQALVAQLKQGNSKISTSVEAAMAMKAVNNWYFETMAIGLKNLPLTTESALREMAERCPQRFGSAVGRAQSILTHYDKSYDPSDECSEGEKSALKASNDFGSEKSIESGEFSEVNDIHIFPNPASGMFTVQLPQNETSTGWRVELFNVRGQVLKTQTSVENQLQIDARDFSVGVYWIRVQSEGHSISKRVIIK